VIVSKELAETLRCKFLQCLKLLNKVAATTTTKTELQHESTRAKQPKLGTWRATVKVMLTMSQRLLTG
jgi:hypothetical protein